MIQVKLFELFEVKNTYQELIEIFSKDRVIKFTNNIIGITYDYSSNNYISILQKVKDLNLRQFIVNSNPFFNMIDFCVKMDFFINNVKFIYPISEESVQFVDDHLERINDTKGKEKVINRNKLFNELDWITSDECIDIKSISIQVSNGVIPIFNEVELYNNGVLLIGDENTLDTVTLMIEEIIKG